MIDSIDAAQQMISRCIRLRNEGRPEAVLRSELASRLRQIFPDEADQSWIDHYTEGTEALTRIARHNGGVSPRFIDNLIRSTVIEYEPDLRLETRWSQGWQQVREYAAGTIRSGVSVSQVRGILSDTVDWYIFDVRLGVGVEPASCGPDDIVLSEVEVLRAEVADKATAERIIGFLRKHLAREQSRTLTATFIAADLGLESVAYQRHIEGLLELVDDGRNADTSIVLATNLWSRFVDYLEGTEGEFRAQAYVDEAYIAILARLLCVNILLKRACLSDDIELSDILTGRYFEDRFHLHNMVEQDYFGWMLRTECLPQILPVAREIQVDLYAYDFSVVQEDDVFGRLMAQLARRTQRKLLGQEWTPQWIARVLAEKCLSLLPDSELPCFVDMCCGSGSIMAEVIKAAKTARPGITFEQLTTVITGFDIDPLAVMLAKTTWVVTLANEIRATSEQVVVPVYHADSLFAVTPITRKLPMPGESTEIIVELDGYRLSMPGSMISPDFLPLFDEIIDWCYDEALTSQDTEDPDAITEDRANQLLSALVDKYGIELSDEIRHQIDLSVYELAHRMGELAVSNRNGIWAFILRNTYRPGLLAGQFNGLVSNPPWLAMSQFADNPYKEQLSARALAYGIKPGGAAHLHLELATTHLLHAVDRYLKSGAAVACLVPGTVFNGQHHAKLRDNAYLEAERSVAFELQDVWGIAPGTFKVRSAALIGVKRSSIVDVSRSDPNGSIATEDGVNNISLTVRRLGRRTAWVLGGSTSPVTAGSDEVPPQGADIMPRPGVCVEIINRSGNEWRVRTPGRDDPSYFAVKSAKKLQGRTFNGVAAPCFIHRMVQSLNLLPFIIDGNFVHIAIPARRDNVGQWEIMNAAAIRTAGYNQTARRFQRIDQAMAADNVVKPLHEKIDERRKLSLQVFPPNQYLVLNGAGGGVACASFLSLSGHPNIVVDQTLYWSLVESEEEAWYRVGLINTDALSEAIREFNPEGELGPRHLHTLPNRVIPPFDPENLDHVQIIDLAEQISDLAGPIITTDQNIADPTKPIASRRRRLRNRLKNLADYSALEDVAAAVLGVTS